MKNAHSEIVEKGKTIYYRIKPELEKKYKPGFYISIEVETGSYFVGKTSIEAVKKARKKFPRRQFFLAQIGRAAGILK